MTVGQSNGSSDIIITRNSDSPAPRSPVGPRPDGVAKSVQAAPPLASDWHQRRPPPHRSSPLFTSLYQMLFASDLYPPPPPPPPTKATAAAVSFQRRSSASPLLFRSASTTSASETTMKPSATSTGPERRHRRRPSISDRHHHHHPYCSPKRPPTLPPFIYLLLIAFIFATSFSSRHKGKPCFTFFLVHRFLPGHWSAPLLSARICEESRPRCTVHSHLAWSVWSTTTAVGCIDRSIIVLSHPIFPNPFFVCVYALNSDAKSIALSPIHSIRACVGKRKSLTRLRSVCTSI